MQSLRSNLYSAALLLLACTPRLMADGNGLTLGNVSAAAKGKVIVPMLLEIENEEVRVGHIAATVSYNADVITFQQPEKGFLLEGVGGKIAVTPKVDGAKSTIDVDVVTEGEPRQALRKGLVLSLIFKVNEGAAADTKVPLQLSAVKLETPDSPAKAIEPLKLTAGEVAVLSPENVPFVSCFFFTH